MTAGAIEQAAGGTLRRISSTTRPMAAAPVAGGASLARTSSAKLWLKAIGLTSRIETEPRRLFADVVEEWAQLQPQRPALLSDVTNFTYADLAARINRYARWAMQIKVGAGVTVCLLMPNRPDHLACWLGITRIGGTVALINTGLVGHSLAHCIEVASADHVVLAAECEEAFSAARSHLSRVPRVWSLGGCGLGADLETALAEQDPRTLAVSERRAVGIDDRALLIYTSGTTGLPKAANVSHRRILSWGGWFVGLTEASIDDRLYDCLPLYHSVGGVVAPCSMLCAGGSVVIAEKFSASEFWNDVVRFDCTIFQYIGELCRYLLLGPTPETGHRLRLAVGNGLRADIWQRFTERFSIPRVLEFYAATEGNFSLFNVEGKPGAIGRIPPLLAHRFPAAIVKVDRADGRPARGWDGLCIPCDVGEVGHAIGRIGTTENGGGVFEGYTDRAETDSKILRDVFVEGDAWFATGDLMRRDDQGYFHFVDRVGDTFRWKGENVATADVSDAIRNCPGVVDAATYGVAVPGCDGRAGMAALVTQDGFDSAVLARHLSRRLPPYAIPVFLRLCRTLDTTETFKQQKQRLVREAFDPSIADDPVFLRHPADGLYRPLDANVRARIADGEIKL